MSQSEASSVKQAAWNIPCPVYEAGSEDVMSYLERLKMYFTLTGVSQTQQVNVLCVILPAEVFKILKDGLSPKEVKDASFSECEKCLQNYYAPTNCQIANRYKFYSRQQHSGESLTEYLTVLRHLASSCNFGTFLPECLRDRLISGITNQQLLRKLLSQADELSWEDTVKQVQDFETVERAQRVLSGDEPQAVTHTVSVVKHQKQSRPYKKETSPKGFGRVSSGYQGSSQKMEKSHRSGHQSPTQKLEKSHRRCHQCGVKHRVEECPAKAWKCFKCGKAGHTSAVCYSKKQVSAKVNHIVMSVSRDSGCESLVSPEAKWIKLNVSGINLDFLVDTGSGTSIISYTNFLKSFPKMQLQTFNGTLTSANGSKLSVKGFFIVNVKYGNGSFRVPLVVVEKLSCSAVLGRNWLDTFNPGWQLNLCTSINVINNGKLAVKLDKQVAIINKYKQMFPRAFSLLDNEKPIKTFKINIKLKDNVIPVFKKSYSVPYALRQQVCQELYKLESQGIIRKVNHSQWASPIVVVPKKNGNIRLCVNFKNTVNPQLEVNQYPLPRVEDLINKFVGCQVFCHVDLTNAYLQLEVDEVSQKLLTINTLNGLYQYKRLVFGLASSPAIFQMVMEQILGDMNKCAIYLDDILIGGTCYEECQLNLEKVLKKLNDYNVKVNMEKSEFFVNSLEFLGFHISADGKQPSKDKINKILNCMVPTNVTQLKSYLSMLSFYRNFIPMCPDLCEPMYKLLRKDVPFVWSADCDIAFNKSKCALSEKSLLVLYDPLKPLSLTVDASQYGVGAVLSHTIDGVEHPIAFESATLNPAQKNYSQLHKEALAVIYGVKKFHQYLYGRQFTIYTDHEPLKFLFSETKDMLTTVPSRILRWSIILSSYNYKIVFKKGKDIPQADFMSRLPSSQPVIETDCNFLFLQTPLVSQELVVKHTENDDLLKKIISHVKADWKMKVEPELKFYFNIRQHLSVFNKCLFFADRIVIPKSLKEKVLALIHQGHSGMVRSKAFARSYVWWRAMDADIENKIKTCRACQTNQRDDQRKCRLDWPKPSGPWDRVHLDFFYFMGKTFLIIVDSFSKWVECLSMSSTKSQSVCEKLNEVFSCFSIPNVIVSDNGPPFNSSEFEKYCADNHIKHILSPPYNPESNGLAERTVQTFKLMLRKQLSDNKNRRDLKGALLSVLYTYRVTPSTVTGASPMSMMLGYQPKTSLSILNSKNHSKKPPEHTLKNKSFHTFAENEIVLVILRNKGHVKNWIPARVCKRLGSVLYLVKLDNGKVVKVHCNQLKRSYLDEVCHPSRIPDYDCDVKSEKIKDCAKEEEADNGGSGACENENYVTRSGRLIKPPARFCESQCS